MNHLPRFLTHKKKAASTDLKRTRRRPRLERRNASKNIDYDAGSCSSSLEDSTSPSPLVTRSLDLPDKTSFRIEGTDGEFERIFRSLGLSGPADFEIPAAAWEARKMRSTSDLLPMSRFDRLDTPKKEKGEEKVGSEAMAAELFGRVLGSSRIVDSSELTRSVSGDLGINGCYICERTGNRTESNVVRVSNGGANGIKGTRPPVLKPPPAMTLPFIDKTCSTWDLLRDFAPDRRSLMVQYSSANEGVDCKEGEELDERYAKTAMEEGENGTRVGETAVLWECSSFTTSIDDDSSSTTTEFLYVSPNSRFRRTITDWLKGDLLGRGSFGSVYEGISANGFFFAVKEVSLLDQGSQGKQSILQLEQEIALLSQFEHENIVQYYGTDKDEANLYIFLELVTKGSLLSLYQKYNLKDSQVSAYTRQILHGLKYLHDRGVVHRDIKCANILVDANGLVKLADFGLAKATKLNDVRSCKGTAFWMAPEVVHLQTQGYGLPADIWSLGCTVLEMLTRQIPYSHLECMQALYRIGKGEPPPVPDDLSKDARDFISQCLQVNPDDRPTAALLLSHPFVKRALSTSLGSASPYISRRS